MAAPASRSPPVFPSLDRCGAGLNTNVKKRKKEIVRSIQISILYQSIFQVTLEGKTKSQNAAQRLNAWREPGLGPREPRGVAQESVGPSSEVTEPGDEVEALNGEV